MQLAEIMNSSTTTSSSTLPSISTLASTTNAYQSPRTPFSTTSTNTFANTNMAISTPPTQQMQQLQLQLQQHLLLLQRPLLPPLVKRISLPPISDILSSSSSNANSPSATTTASGPTQTTFAQHMLPPVSQLSSQTYNYYTTTNDRMRKLNKSPVIAHSTSATSIPTSMSPASNSYLSHQYQQYAPSPQQQQQQQQQQQSHIQTSVQVHLSHPSLARAQSFPQQSTPASSCSSSPSSLSSPQQQQQQQQQTNHQYSHHSYSHSHLAPANYYTGSQTPQLGLSPQQYSKRKTRNNLPKEITYVLLRWLNDHLNHPYPNSFEKNQLMLTTGLNQQQLSNWFINARRRKIKLLKEQKRMSLI
ncbi:hypothetical protein LELG_05517 [Lodderomyces elongisporus NRRL YB-4239]|uniref:Homeobox domain-containing protein n=1 Tax=Lodderomyces elongisporus (strain ATCC 11503 / CBS 2605 / JCM 1781 / NBRC 1676 / NRRL YB-4239) TaxID=379508 RepID=A5E7C8_LODEL|nr:hypothetical protein LELG_05517 [Lodderomyces elongisporus NRRL YB-4239]